MFRFRPAELPVEAHATIQAHSRESREGNPRGQRNHRPWHGPRQRLIPLARALSDFITERFDDFSRSQKDVARYIVDHLDEAAFQTAEELARRAKPLPPTVVRLLPGPWLRTAIPSCSRQPSREYRHKVAEGDPNGNGGSGAAALFNFDHSEFEASLGADYSNIEGNGPQPDPRADRGIGIGARDLQARADRGVEQMAFFASYLRHLLGCWTSARRSSHRPARTTSRSFRGWTRTPCWSC